MKDNYESEFSKKNIIITGASSGVGLYTAIYFLNQNANVILACKDIYSIKEICDKNHFINAIILQVDLQVQSQVRKFINCVQGIFTKIDILINCAGIKLDSDILTTFSEDFDFTMNTNLRSVFILIKELKPNFAEGASIINMSCLYGTRPICGFISYSMSKAGLETLTKYAAAEYAHLNIRINAISARIAEGEDIVKVIIFLASKRSKKITGQIIKVDGGRSLTSSGYIHYKGMLNMNSKLEPDGEKINKDKLYSVLNNKNEIMDKPITNKSELKQFVENTIKKSNFSTRNMEAFLNVKNTYYRLDNNNNILSKKFLRLESKSQLLRLSSEKDNKFNIVNDIKKINEESKDINNYMNNIIDNNNENKNKNENENIINENDNEIKNSEIVPDEE